MEQISPSITYAGMKEANKKVMDIISYNDMLLLSAAAMFEYVHENSGEPFEDFRTEFIDLYNAMFGNGALIDSKEFATAGTANPETGILVVMAERAGAPNANGLGRDLICTTRDGRNVVIKDFETTGRDRVVYFKNNKYAYPDFTIGESGDILAEIQKSKRHNIINSRLTPIVIAKDAKAKKGIEKALEENKSGSYAVVLSDNIITEGQEFVLKVTDVQDQDKIQYLNHAYDDEFRHWYNLHGLDITGASKQAQQTEAEVSSGVNSRKIIPYEMLREREKMAKRVNELYGLDLKVQFSKPWRLEFGLEETPVEAAEAEAMPENDPAPETETETIEETEKTADETTEGGGEE